MKQTFIAPVIAALTLLSCTDPLEKDIRLEELGLPTAEYTVENEAGILTVQYYASSKGQISSDSPWIRLEESSFSKDGTLRIAYEDNPGFPRMATVKFSLDANPSYSAALSIFQEGTEQPYLRLPSAAVSVFNTGSINQIYIPVYTNLSYENISLTTRILDGDGQWVGTPRLDEGRLFLRLSDNTTDSKRVAAITLSYDNGWGQTVSKDLRIVQAGKDNSFGESVSFGELREKASADGTMLTGGILEAYVVSDPESGNINTNPQIASRSIDYSIGRRSAYIESLDGKYGFLVILDSEEDNILLPDTKVLLDLTDASVKKYGNPLRFTIENLSASGILGMEDAAGSIPEKRRRISELTDDDIYTRVVLQDVEIPVRKGSLTPAYEFMTNACGNDCATKYATLLRGSDGASMYIWTNTTCPYRRDGTRLGYGRGSLQGVIVHEKHRPFVDEDAATEDECGNVGRYQIRHMSRSDFRFADSFADSFSEMICEWRYTLPGDYGYLDATYGSGRMIHTGGSYSEYANYGFRGLTYYDFSYLGPVGNSALYTFGNNRGNVNGFGIILEDGTDYGVGGENPIVANADGRGRTARLQDGNLAWGAVYWWNAASSTPYYWSIEFSTEGIDTDCLSMQLSMLNQDQSGLSPRFWKAEWSTTGDFSGDYEESWHSIAEFSVPDITPDNFDPAPWMSSAFKPMDFPLPLEMLGHEKVYIRIGPASNKASDRNGYANATIENTNYCGGTMNYFAVRYNKEKASEQ